MANFKKKSAITWYVNLIINLEQNSYNNWPGYQLLRNFATSLFPLRATGVLKRKIAKVRKAFVHRVEDCAILITSFKRFLPERTKNNGTLRVLHTFAINGPEMIRIPQ